MLDSARMIPLTLVLLVGLTGGSASTASADQLPDPIGYIELDGGGRFDIHPIADGMTAIDAARPMNSDGSRPTAFWSSRGDRGGQVVIFALAAPDDPTKGAVSVTYHLNDERSDLYQRQSRGVTYYEPYAGVRFGHGWRRGLKKESTVEELSLDSEGRMSLRLRFDGKAYRSNGDENSDDVRLKGTLVVDGLPYASN